MSPIDAYLSKLPGSVAAKAFAASLAVGFAVAYPVFFVSKEGRQGHDYFSSERPEAISAAQDRARKQNRIDRGLVLESGRNSSGDDSSGTTGEKRD